MNYKEALAYIHSTNKFGIKLGLENMKALLEELGNPHRDLKFIHIGGTNGKGSTSAMIHSILSEAGYRVGLFISPYLEEFTERIQINGQPIGENELAQITQEVRTAIDVLVTKGANHPTEFELITAIGLVYFQRQGVDFVVLEVGLGGRLDATNIIEASEVSVITAIGWDHMEHLGYSIQEIAAEKAGIIKEGGRVVLYPQDAEVSKVIQDISDGLGAEVFYVGEVQVGALSASLGGQSFSYWGEVLHLSEVEIKLLGRHQIRNAATALRAIEVLISRGFEVSQGAVIDGMKKARWPGRFELIQDRPIIILDGAHNLQGAEAFFQTASQLFPGHRMILVLGILRDKEVDKMIDTLLPLAKSIITIAPDNPRALSSKELAERIRGRADDLTILPMDSMGEVLEWIGGCRGNEIIAFAGSLYMIGEARKYLTGRVQ